LCNNYFSFLINLDSKIGDWGLGIGDWGLGPIPKTPTPKPKTQNIKIYIKRYANYLYIKEQINK